MEPDEPVAVGRSAVEIGDVRLALFSDGKLVTSPATPLLTASVGRLEITIAPSMDGICLEIDLLAETSLKRPQMSSS